MTEVKDKLEKSKVRLADAFERLEYIIENQLCYQKEQINSLAEENKSLRGEMIELKHKYDSNFDKLKQEISDQLTDSISQLEGLLGNKNGNN